MGDYRGWARGYTPQTRPFEDWAREHELWRMDLKDFDLGLVEDKIERAVREIYNRYLLTEAGAAKLVLVLPSLLPHRLLSTLLVTLFNRWKFTAITLLPSPAMATLAAGLRSGLVVDIGWHETTVTSVYEYREIHALRTTRAMKTLTERMGRRLVRDIEVQGIASETKGGIEYDLVEDIIARLAVCRRKTGNPKDDSSTSIPQIGPPFFAQQATNPSNGPEEDKSIEVDWPLSTSSRPVKIPFRTFCEPVELNFLPSNDLQDLDDDEKSLPFLVYKSLLLLPPDLRASCMSRICFVGGGSAIPGLRQRVMREAAELVSGFGWSPVRGKKVEERNRRLVELNRSGPRPFSAHSNVPDPPRVDPIEEKVQRRQAKKPQPLDHGILSQVDSLGAWAGASLLASLKVKGSVEVERDRFLSHGLSGAHRYLDVSVVPPRQSFASGMPRAGGERSSWTLAGWG